MTKKEEYEQKTEKLLEPLMEKHNYELVDVEYVREGSNWFLRAFIDKEGGFTVDDCELVSRALSELLDAKDFIPDSYILEVSSPGLGRQLKKDKDFARSIGEEVEIKLYKAVKIQYKGKTTSRKDLFGVLLEYDENKITIKTEEEETMDILRSDIAIIRLALDF
jgi:ribosome maturation factor RimP